ncbi:MAG: FtsX-like permease family protein [Bacteroidota bacterium]
MLRHYLKIGIRNALKHLNYAFINVFGLALGLTSFIFIMIYVADELSFDRFHAGYDRIYRVNRLYNSNDINEDAATCSFPFAPALFDDYPDMVETYCRFFDFQRSSLLFEYQKSEEERIKFNEDWFYLADSNVFELFTFPLIEGDPKTALVRPNTVVISESTARRYFGSEPAMGKTLRIEEAAEVEITGIMKDLPLQSHFRIDILGSMSTFREILGGQLPQTWIWNPCWTYIKLKDKVKPEQLNARFPDFYLAHYPDFQNQDVTLYLQPLKDIHLKSHHEYEMRPNGNITYIRILSMIAVFVLILAIINFMNLATANSAGRAREIGLKKVLGARKKQLMVQFLGEALIFTFFALIIAVAATELLLPAFNRFTAKDIPHHLFIQPVTLLMGLGLLLLVGLLAGSYPAFFLSGLDSSRFRGEIVRGSKSGTARKILVISQFLISIALIIGTISAYSQLNYLKKADLGFNKEQVILLPSVAATSNRFEAFAEELKNHSEVMHVTGMEDILGVNHNTRRVFIEGLGEENFYYYPAFMVRYEFLETFDIPVVAGRGFSRDFPADTANAIMINETMVKNLGWTNESAIGKRIRSDGDERVIGVFGDFHALSLHKPVSNFILDMVNNPRGAAGLTRYIAIKARSDNYTELLKFIQGKWEEFAPTRPFEYSFLDEEIDALYKDEQKFSSISIMITILAIIIACLGLVGLTSFLVEQKTKEICVRRVHGATFSDVNRLLSAEFLRLISVAILISWPLAYFVVHHWLISFSQHIAMQWIVFIISGIVAVMLVLLITSAHARKATRINPAYALKYE